jgi:hypothetical protein
MKKSRRSKRSNVRAQPKLADDLVKLALQAAGSVKDLPSDLSERKKEYLKMWGYGLDGQTARTLRNRKDPRRD